MESNNYGTLDLTSSKMRHACVPKSLWWHGGNNKCIKMSFYWYMWLYGVISYLFKMVYIQGICWKNPNSFNLI